jgi:ABC-type phosphate transport system substrate-binding protein
MAIWLSRSSKRRIPLAMCGSAMPSSTGWRTGQYKMPRGDSGHPISSSVAAAAVKTMPADFRISITNPPGERAYPIASFTWLLVPESAKSAEKQEAMRQFLHWILSSGQNYAATFGFAPLPAAVVTKELEAIDKTE